MTEAALCLAPGISILTMSHGVGTTNIPSSDKKSQMIEGKWPSHNSCVHQVKLCPSLIWQTEQCAQVLGLHSTITKILCLLLPGFPFGNSKDLPTALRGPLLFLEFFSICLSSSPTTDFHLKKNLSQKLKKELLQWPLSVLAFPCLLWQPLLPGPFYSRTSAVWFAEVIHSEDSLPVLLHGSWEDRPSLIILHSSSRSPGNFKLVQ